MFKLKDLSFQPYQISYQKDQFIKKIVPWNEFYKYNKELLRSQIKTRVSTLTKENEKWMENMFTNYIYLQMNQGGRSENRSYLLHYLLIGIHIRMKMKVSSKS